MRTTNPALRPKLLEKYASVPSDQAMTVEGTINKAGLLLFLVVVPAAWVWMQVMRAVDPVTVVGPWVLGGAVGGLVVGLVTCFKQEWSPVTAPIYALLEGLALGGLSAWFELTYHGIVVQAVALTFATLVGMLAAYRAGLIRATERFKAVVVTATCGIALFYLVSLGLGFFGIAVPYFQSTSTASIVLNLVIAGVAALNFVLDFDFITTGAEHGAPKFLEWYGAFGLMVTLIWLYLELLRLLSRLRRR